MSERELRPAASADDGALVIDTLVLCRDLGNGAWTAQPLAWPKLVAYGSQAGAITQLRELLEHQLLDSPAPLIARFGLPADTRLTLLRAELSMHRWPRRLRCKLPTDFAAVSLPQGHDRWVMVPRIGHTFFVRRGDDDRFVLREVSRIANLRGIDGDLRRLLPAQDVALVPLRLRLALANKAPGKRAGGRQRARVAAFEREAAEELLEKVGKPLHKRGVGAMPARLVGRDGLSARLHDSLSGARRQGCCWWASAAWAKPRCSCSGSSSKTPRRKNRGNDCVFTTPRPRSSSPG